MPASFNNLVLANWAAAMALWAVPYLTLLHHFQLEASEAMQWSLVLVSVAGSASVFLIAWRESRDARWRAAHGLLARPKSGIGRR